MNSRFIRRATFACAALLGALKPLAAQMDMSHMDMKMAPDPLGVSMDRFGSGTTWIPDAVSLPAYRAMAGSWSLMSHGFLFAQQDVQSGPRGGSQFGSLNWGMFMASRELGGGRFQARTMLSLDRLGVGEGGYPLLLQTGEGFIDRQHPHDFWMELGAMYERPINERIGWLAYAAPSGEPALGPVAFMHRPSAMDLPTAPIAHHWQDATHISFGVLTAGVFGNRWKLEASSFNGTDPDSNRWNIDPIHLNSYSTRLTMNPSKNWSVSAGYGLIRDTESLHRITASALYGRPIGANGQWSSTAVWGANAEHDARLANSVLAESELVFDRTNTVFARAEWLQRPPAVAQLSAGYVREIARWSGATLGLGGMGTVNAVPAALDAGYGSRTPLGGMIFLRVRPILQRRQ